MNRWIYYAAGSVVAVVLTSLVFLAIDEVEYRERTARQDELRRHGWIR